MWGLFKKRKPTLEEQISTLAECGIRLRPGITVEHLLASFERPAYENDPYGLLLTMMGSQTEDEAAIWMSDNIWHLDTECIEDHGSYTAVAERMRDLAGRSLPIQGIRDHVNVDEGVAWLEFTLDGQRVHWDAKVQDDWIDPTIMSRFAKLLPGRSSEKRFTYLDLQGQDCLIGCCSPAELKQLKARTSLAFTELT